MIVWSIIVLTRHFKLQQLLLTIQVRFSLFLIIYSVCDDGTWGENCSSECQNCLNDNKCDTVNGFCPNGCTAGWREPTCNTSNVNFV